MAVGEYLLVIEAAFRRLTMQLQGSSTYQLIFNRGRQQGE